MFPSIFLFAPHIFVYSVSSNFYLSLQVLVIGLVVLTPGDVGSRAGAIAGKYRFQCQGSCKPCALVTTWLLCCSESLSLSPWWPGMLSRNATRPESLSQFKPKIICILSKVYVMASWTWLWPFQHHPHFHHLSQQQQPETTGHHQHLKGSNRGGTGLKTDVSQAYI